MLQRVGTNQNPLWVSCHLIPPWVGVCFHSPPALERLQFPQLSVGDGGGEG